MHNIPSMRVNLCLDQIVAELSRDRPCPKTLRQKVEKMVPEASSMVQPAVTYCWTEVAMQSDNKVQLRCRDNNTDIVIRPGSGCELLGPARQVLIAAWTIGRQIDDKIASLHKKGMGLESYLFDCIGLHALEKIGDVVKHEAEQRTTEKGWGTSVLISPGSIKGWDLTEQQLICSLLNLGSIDLRMNSSHVLIPFKSVTGVIGIGPDYGTAAVGSSCLACQKRDDCPKSTYYKEEERKG